VLCDHSSARKNEAFEVFDSASSLFHSLEWDFGLSDSDPVGWLHDIDL